MKQVDIIKFLEDLFVLENNKPIKLEFWQKKNILKPVFYDLNRDGRRKINLALIGEPKKNGKSTIASGVAAYGLLGDGEAEPEIYGCAGDKDQAKIIFNQTAKAFKRSPLLNKEVKIYKDVIERKDGRGLYQVLSADAPTAHGLNPHYVIWDELWNQRSYDLWEALTHSPARKQPLHFVVTYAGYDQYEGNLLWDLYQRGLKGKDRRMYMWWSHKNLASWVSPEYLKQQKDRLPEHIYKRLHENRWVGGIGAFLTREDIDSCTDATLGQQPGGEDAHYFVGVDLGLSKDRTVVAVCHKDRESERVVLDNIRTWQGSKTKKVNIEEVEDWILFLTKNFHVIDGVLADPWQAQNSIQRLKRQRVPIEEFQFTAANVARLSSALFSLFKNRRISIFDYQPLVRELMTAKIVEKSYGFRLDHGAGGYTDHLMAVGMAAMHADMSQADSSRINLRWIQEHSFKDEDLKGKKLRVISSLNPVVGKSAEGSLAALVTCGWCEKDKKIYVLDCEMRSLSPQAQVDMCVDKVNFYLDECRKDSKKADKNKALTEYVGLQIEADAFQLVLKDIIRRKSGHPFGKTVTVKTVSKDGDQISRDRLSPLVEDGTVRFKEQDLETLINQLTQFSRGDNDSGPDALEMCVRALSRWGQGNRVMMMGSV